MLSDNRRLPINLSCSEFPPPSSCFQSENSLEIDDRLPYDLRSQLGQSSAFQFPRTTGETGTPCFVPADCVHHLPMLCPVRNAALQFLYAVQHPDPD